MSDNRPPPQLPNDVLYLVALELRLQDAGRTLVSLARSCRAVKGVVQPLIDKRLAISCRVSPFDRFKSLLSDLTPAAPDAGPAPGKKARHPKRTRERAAAKLSRLQKCRELCLLTCPTPTHFAHVRRLVKILQASTIFSNVQHLEVSAKCLHMLSERDYDALHDTQIPSLALLCSPRSICFHLPSWTVLWPLPCVCSILEAYPGVERACVHLDSTHKHWSTIEDLVPLHVADVELIDVSREEHLAAGIVDSILGHLESRSEFRAESAMRLSLGFPNVATQSLPILLKSGTRPRTSSPTTNRQAAIRDARNLLAGNPNVDNVTLYNVNIVVGKRARCSRGSLMMGQHDIQSVSDLLIGSVDSRQGRHQASDEEGEPAHRVRWEVGERRRNGRPGL